MSSGSAAVYVYCQNVAEAHSDGAIERVFAPGSSYLGRRLMSQEALVVLYKRGFTASDARMSGIVKIALLSCLHCMARGPASDPSLCDA